MNDHLVALYRYFINADHMRYLFDNRLREIQIEIQILPKDEQQDILSKFDQHHIYLDLWYGLLWVLVEGWQNLKIQDQTIATLLQDESRKKKLREFRNVVMHVHSDFYYENLDQQHRKPSAVQRRQAVFEDTGLVTWTRMLTIAYSNYFRAQFEQAKN